MDPTVLSESPYAVLTFIAAPALLTNASSLLALSTTNRVLRTRDRMHQLFVKSEAGGLSETESSHLLDQVNRIEQQAEGLLRGLYWVYVALASFAGSTLITLLGAVFAAFNLVLWFHILGVTGLIMAFVGCGGLVTCCISLFYATQISIFNIHDEAAAVRTRLSQKPQKSEEAAAEKF